MGCSTTPSLVIGPTKFKSIIIDKYHSKMYNHCTLSSTIVYYSTIVLLFNHRFFMVLEDDIESLSLLRLYIKKLWNFL